MDLGIEGRTAACGPGWRAAHRIVAPDAVLPDPQAGCVRIKDEHHHIARAMGRQAGELLGRCGGIRGPERAIAAPADRAQCDRAVAAIELFALFCRCHAEIAVKLRCPTRGAEHLPIALSVPAGDRLGGRHPAAVIAAAGGVDGGLVALRERVACRSTCAVKLPGAAEIDRGCRGPALREDRGAHHQKAHATGPASAP